MADIKLKDRNDNETTYTGVSKLKVPAADGGEDVVFQLPPTLQKKTVSVTENGTTEITPDAGSDALSAVELTVNVQATSALPPSTAADKDKFLRVDASGNPAWETVNAVEKFVVTGELNISADGSSTLTNVDHTVNEAVAAYNAGMRVELHAVSDGIPIILQSIVMAMDGGVYFTTAYGVGNVNIIMTIVGQIQEGADEWSVFNDIIRELPSHSSDDVGKFLRVDATGNPAWETVSDTTIKLKSSTAGSTKYFNITVNDSGQITATEAT